MFRWFVIIAIASRNFKQYFTSVTGYLFVFVFVTICATLTFNETFFADNLANLDQLSHFFPSLLLFFVPAISMASWAEETRQGTDAILFTLPASDLEILLGKFCSVVAVYTVALLFSLTQVVTLCWIGDPDMGVIITTYIGYWLAGVALLSIGLFASSLTQSATVAFVLGAVFCSFAVLLQHVFHSPFFVSYSIGGQLHGFTLGLISLPAVVFFLSITLWMLSLNLVVIGKRHWNRGKRHASMGRHHFTRVVCLVVALIAINSMAANSHLWLVNRMDLTDDSIYSLHKTTHDVIERAAVNDRPVTIQAFVSSEVPRNFVAVKKRLLGLLRQYDRLGGNQIEVRIVDVRPNSQQVKEARTIGVQPYASREKTRGRVIEQDVFLGVLMTSSHNEVLLPNLDESHSLEYELTRSLATTTAETTKIRLGILETDAHFGNLEMNGVTLPWTADKTLQELKRQYDVVNVSLAEFASINKHLASENTSFPSDDGLASQASGHKPASAQPGLPPDVLLVADPSSLTRQGLKDLIQYIETGQAVLIMADPLPFFFFTYRGPRGIGIVNAPRSPRIPGHAKFAPLAISHEPKVAGGRALPLLEALGIQWQHDRVVWNLVPAHLGFKPHIPSHFSDRWPENYGQKNKMFVFANSSTSRQGFNADSPITNGLQEMMFVYPGSLTPTEGSPTEFVPLITLAPQESGHYDWEEFTEELVTTRTQRNRFTGKPENVSGPAPNDYFGGYIRVIKKNPRLQDDNRDTLLDEPSKKIDGSESSEVLPFVKLPREPLPDPSAPRGSRPLLDADTPTIAAYLKGKGDNKTNVVFVADIDFATDMVHRQQLALDQPLDNFTFLVNAIETLAGDTSFVSLRNRRQCPPMLDALESMTVGFRRAAAEAAEKTERKINRKLTAQQAQLDQQSATLQNDQQLNDLQKFQQQMFQTSTAAKTFELRKKKLETERENRLADISTQEQNQIDSVQRQVWVWAVAMSGVPALLLGCLVLTHRWNNERKSIAANRRI